MKTARRAVVALILASLLLIVLAQTASAGIVFCSPDLGPMATRAEGKIVDTPAADITEDLTPQVPVQAVSTSKGGSNTHK